MLLVRIFICLAVALLLLVVALLSLPAAIGIGITSIDFGQLEFANMSIDVKVSYVYRLCVAIFLLMLAKIALEGADNFFKKAAECTKEDN